MQEALKLAEVKGYLTAKVDEYSKYPECKVSSRRVAEDFYKILEIVIDMQQQDEAELISSDAAYEARITSLKRKIRDFEETCRDNSELIDNQSKKIQTLNYDNYRLTTTCKSLKERLGEK